MFEAPIKDPITRPPDLKGSHGKAWSADIDAMVKRARLTKDDDATLAYWVIEAPWANPMWHSYALVLVHLRDTSRFKRADAVIHLEGATHEMWLYALHPDSSRERSMLEGGSSTWMTPANFVAQLVEPSDESARDRIKRAVQDIVDGRLSPDTDYRYQWKERFGSSMIKKGPPQLSTGKSAAEFYAAAAAAGESSPLDPELGPLRDDPHKIPKLH